MIGVCSLLQRFASVEIQNLGTEHIVVVSCEPLSSSISVFFTGFVVFRAISFPSFVFLRHEIEGSFRSLLCRLCCRPLLLCCYRIVICGLNLFIQRFLEIFFLQLLIHHFEFCLLHTVARAVSIKDGKAQ